MAEEEQPKKGSTSKFSDTLGKMDALIFNALGVNVESLLDALGIKSLKELFNLDWSKINWAKFLNILYALNPSQLKMLLSKFNLSNFNLASLLSIFGISAPMIALLDQIKSSFSQGGGIFTGGTSTLGIDGSWKPATGWLPGYDESLLDINNPPFTGLKLQTPDDPNDPKYVPPGSENVLNVLAGVNSAEGAIEALCPPGGTGDFYYDWIETPVRFDVSKFVPWTDVGGFDYLRSYFCQKLGEIPSDNDFQILTEEGRVDLIANSMYQGTYLPTQYWWIIMMYNGIYDLDELKTGCRLQAPNLEDLEDLYFRVKSMGE
jgi:hypothetical protein